MNSIKHVLVFEYLNIIKNRAFLITNLIFAVGIFIFAFFPSIAALFSNFGGEKEDEIKYAAYIDEIGVYDAALLTTYFPDYEWVSYEPSQIDEIIEGIKNKDISIGVHFKGRFTYDLLARSSTNGVNLRPYNEMIINIFQKDELAQQNISDEKIHEILNAPISATHVSVDGGSFWVGYFVIILTFMPLVLYGSSIATAVVNEKTSKTVELLFTSTTPNAIIFGKVFGVCLVLLTQVTFLGTVAVLALTLSGGVISAVFSASTLALLSDISIYIFIFLLCGFVSYAFLYAACASTARDAQEISSVTAIPSLLSLAGFYIGIFTMIGESSATFANIASFVPFLSPSVMISRICTSYVPFYQILITIAINIATVIFAGIISSKIYSVCIMAHGKKFTAKSLLSHMMKG